MKTYILSVLILFPLCLFAQQEVTLSEVKTASVHYISVQNPYRSTYSLSDIDTVTYLSGEAGPAIYETLFQDGNSVLLSGSKACIPILGHNFSGKGESVVAGVDVPLGLQAMLSDMVVEIDSCLLNDTIMLYHAAEWSALLSPDYLLTKSKAIEVGPLTTSKWGQSRSNDADPNQADAHAYNYYVTETNDDCGDKLYCPAGCVAVAMAQVLYYWKHPMNSGFHDYYDWCNMPDSLLFFNNPNYENERDAVAKLIHNCGAQASMNYCYMNKCQSFAWPLEMLSDILSAFFGLNSAIDHKWRMWNVRHWEDMLKDDIDNGWPVIYSGLSAKGGHTFICDGYDSDDKFHFNWGWNGNYDGLWLKIKDLKPGSHNFNNFQNAIFNIRPDNSYINYCNSTIDLPFFYYQYHAAGSRDFWNIVPDNVRFLESCGDNTPAAWRTIPSGERSRYAAFESVVLRPGFTAEAGSDFRAYIKDCPNCANQRGGILNEPPDNTGNKKDVLADDLVDEIRITSDISIFPNPNAGIFYVNITPSDNIDFVEITNLQGLVIYQNKEKIYQKTQIDISGQPQGIYFLKIRRNGIIEAHKIIKI